jgi:hypothetical protein
MSEDHAAMDVCTQLKLAMAEVAERHHQVLEHLSPWQAGDYIKRLIDDHTVVFGVWADPSCPGGCDMFIIKGERELQAAVATGETITIHTVAVPCACIEQAIAARDTWGDGIRKSH